MEDDKNYIKILLDTAAHSSCEEVNAVLDSVHKRIASRKKIRRLRAGLAASTALAVALLAVIGLDRVERYKEANQMVCLDNSSSDKIKQFSLPDGTSVVLAPGGIFNYKENTFLTNRRVSVEGEAWFDVKRDDLHPFFVDIPGGVVKVVGTAFDVKTGYVSSTVLERGSVELYNNDGELLLRMSPGQKAEVSCGRLLSVEEVDLSMYTSWKNPYTIYDFMSFKDIIDLLEKRFAVKFQYSERDFSNVECRFVLFENHSLEDVMRILSTIVPLDYNYITDNLVTIRRTRK